MQQLVTRVPLSPASDSDTWLRALRSSGPAYDQAVDSLYALLLRAARFEVVRRRAAVAYVRGEEIEDLAAQAAADLGGVTEVGHLYGRVPLPRDPSPTATAWSLRVPARRGIRRILRAKLEAPA